MHNETDQTVLDLGQTFLDRLRAEHANAVAHAERLASTIESIEQTLRVLSAAPMQQQMPLASHALRPQHSIAVPAAAAIGSAPAPSTVSGSAGNGWARRLRGLSQHEALIQIAEDNGGVVKTGEAADIIIKAGISHANRRNLYRHLLTFLTTSGKFQKAGKGMYRLVENRPDYELDLIPWDELAKADTE